MLSCRCVNLTMLRKADQPLLRRWPAVGPRDAEHSRIHDDEEGMAWSLLSVPGVGPNCGPYTTGSGAAAPAPRSLDAEVPGLDVELDGVACAKIGAQKRRLKMNLEEVLTQA
jgi:hypothetical protein